MKITSWEILDPINFEFFAGKVCKMFAYKQTETIEYLT